MTDEGAEELTDTMNNLDDGTPYVMRLAFTVPTDDDGDGFDSTVDCDDDDATSYPGAPESCNGVDNDCDGTADNDPVYVTYYLDSDGDGFGGAGIDSCNGPIDGTIEVGGDCSDVDPFTYPGAPERQCPRRRLRHPIDEDVVFVTAYTDADGDGYGGIATAEDFCDGVPDDRILVGGDCVDDDATVYPEAPERCDNKTTTATASSTKMSKTCFGTPTAMGTGTVMRVLSRSSRRTRRPSASLETTATATILTTAYVQVLELCDGLDNDCNELEDDGLTSLVFGWGRRRLRRSDQKVETCDGLPPNFIDRGRDCDDADPKAYPGAIEVCDGALNDCNGNLLDGESVDADLDGVPLCADCNDTDLTVYPAPELCDGFDHDCDGVIPAVNECDPFIGESIDVNSSCGATTVPTGPVGWGWLFAMTALLGVVAPSERVSHSPGRRWPSSRCSVLLLLMVPFVRCVRALCCSPRPWSAPRP